MRDSVSKLFSTYNKLAVSNWILGPPEVRLLQRAFKTYRKKTCIRFQPRKSEPDFLNIIKGLGFVIFSNKFSKKFSHLFRCYSQVGKTGGKQEISLGRGCLFNETIVHELMHSLGFWHEHSRAGKTQIPNFEPRKRI